MAYNADNNNTDNEQNDQENKPLNSGGGVSNNSTSQSGRIANYSTGNTNPQFQSGGGSGRFTNIQKYINANEGAGQRMGQQVASSVTRDVNKQDKKVTDQNALIADAMNKGKTSLDQGTDYTNQLQNIQQGFQGFQNMDNRNTFDQAGQDILAFQANQPQFQNFQNIQSGQAIDETDLTAQQQQALLDAQNLKNLTNQNLSNLQTEQGRFSLLQGLSQNKPSAGKFTSGGTRLDQLLFQGDASNPIDKLRNTFLDQSRAADVRNQSVATQGQNLNTLLDNETNVVNKLKQTAQGAQNAFNEALYGDANFANNLKAVSDARKQRFDDLKNSLLAGKISAQDAEMLGLTNLGRYNPTSAENNPFNQNLPTEINGIKVNPNIKNNAMNNTISVDGKTFYTPGNVGIYNLLSDPNNINKYITQNNPEAISAQDITSADDYNVYSALRNLTGLDTGKVAGSTQLGSSINTMNNQLQKDIIAQNQALQNKDETGFYTKETGSPTSVYGGSGPSMATTLHLAQQLQNRGFNPTSAFTPNALANDDLFNRAGINATGQQVSEGWFTFSPTQGGIDRYQQQLYSNNLQDLINQGYFNEIQVDESLNKPSRYRGLL